jgi:alcohol dehydrogenase class IV
MEGEWSPDVPKRVVIPVVTSKQHIALNYIVALGFGSFALVAGIVTLVLQRPRK